LLLKYRQKWIPERYLITGGAEQLIGPWRYADFPIMVRSPDLQCVFVDTPEVERVVDFIGEQRGYPQAFMLPEYIDEKDAERKRYRYV
jgi:S-DNA-T family DNA segregation ATPase FtsK/SpoIIIE